MKKRSQKTGIRRATGAAKQKARRFLNAVIPKENRVERSSVIKSELHLQSHDSSLTASEVTFIQSQLEKGNKSFVKCLGFKSLTIEGVSQAEVKVSLGNAKELVEHYVASPDIITLVTLILNHAEFPVSHFIMSVKLAPEVFRDLAILFRKVNKCTSFWLIARAKMLRPEGPVISELFELITDEYIATLNVGIGVITFNRKDHLAKTVEAIKAFTTGDYQLVVADDGSKDDTVEWCEKNNVAHTNCANKGVVRNKNRALYYLNEIIKVDVLIL